MTKKSKKTRVLPFGIAFAFGFIVSASLMVAFIHDLFEGESLRVNSIVVSQTTRVKSDEVHEYLSHYLGKPLLGIDLREVSHTLQEHPWVKDARVERVLPDALRIIPIEHKAIALSKDDSFLLDEDGKAILKSSKNESLPVINVAKQNLLQARLGSELIATYNSSSKAGGLISEVTFDPNDAPHVLFESGLRVVFGKGEFHEQWNAFEKILDTLKGKSESLEYIYLANYPNSYQVAVKLNER